VDGTDIRRITFDSDGAVQTEDRLARSCQDASACWMGNSKEFGVPRSFCRDLSMCAAKVIFCGIVLALTLF
jgi:hypothetical protein